MKTLVIESGRDKVLSLLEAASALASSPLAYVESRAAFARHRREGRLDRATGRRLAGQLDLFWRSVAAIELDDHVRVNAALLAEQHALRGAEAVHLASARVLGPSTTFACFDRRLWAAARELGFRVIPAEEP